VLLAFPEGFLRQPAPGDFLFQLLVGKDQIYGALAQRVVDFPQVEVGLMRGAMRLLERGDDLRKKCPARRTVAARVAGELPGKINLINACSWIPATSSVPNPRVRAWRPKPIAACKPADRSRFRCLRNAAW